MIKVPVKDQVTIPWMTQREIPAIKAILSAWRERRKVWKRSGFAGHAFRPTQEVADSVAMEAATSCEIIAIIDETLRKETK